MWIRRRAGDPCAQVVRVCFKNIFGGGSSAPPPPAPTPLPPPTMPDPNNPANLEAQRQAMLRAMKGGRSSTILTTAANRPGGAGSTIAGSAGSATLGGG